MAAATATAPHLSRVSPSGETSQNAVRNAHTLSETLQAASSKQAASKMTIAMKSSLRLLSVVWAQAKFLIRRADFVELLVFLANGVLSTAMANLWDYACYYSSAAAAAQPIEAPNEKGLPSLWPLISTSFVLTAINLAFQIRNGRIIASVALSKTASALVQATNGELVVVQTEPSGRQLDEDDDDVQPTAEPAASGTPQAAAAAATTTQAPGSNVRMTSL